MSPYLSPGRTDGATGKGRRAVDPLGPTGFEPCEPPDVPHYSALRSGRRMRYDLLIDLLAGNIDLNGGKGEPADLRQRLQRRHQPGVGVVDLGEVELGLVGRHPVTP